MDDLEAQNDFRFVPIGGGPFGRLALQQYAAIARMRGPEGSPIHLLVRRAGNAELIDFKVERAQVRLQSVAAEMLTPEFGYLRITSFTDTTAAELERAIERLERHGPAKLKGFVIDGE